VDLKEHIDAMSDTERHKTAGMLNRSLSKAKEIFDEANDIRRFLSATSIATMRNWGNHPGCPMPFYINLSTNSLHVGRSEHEVLRINIPRSFWNTLGPLPSVTEMDIAAE
jgi:hypothetical protein